MLVDVSHTIEHGMITYRGLPAPLVCDFLSREQSRSHYAPGTEFHIGKIEMVANTGTYLDAPFHPYLTKDAAEYLLAVGAALVGIDSLNIDDIGDLSRPVHSLLLAAEVPIVEHLRGLGQLPGADFRFFAVPVKVRNMGTFPVRAFGLLE
jgi:kynurenine formamidase